MDDLDNIDASNYDTDIRKVRPVSAYPSHKYQSQKRESSAMTMADTGYRGGMPSSIQRDHSGDPSRKKNVTPGMQQAQAWQHGQMTINDDEHLSLNIKASQFRMDTAGDESHLSIAEENRPYTADPLEAVKSGLVELKGTIEQLQEIVKNDPQMMMSLTFHIEQLEAGITELAPKFVTKEHDLGTIDIEVDEYDKLKMAMDMCGTMENIQTQAPGLHAHLLYFGSKFKRLHADIGVYDQMTKNLGIEQVEEEKVVELGVAKKSFQQLCELLFNLLTEQTFTNRKLYQEVQRTEKFRNESAVLKKEIRKLNRKLFKKKNNLINFTPGGILTIDQCDALQRHECYIRLMKAIKGSRLGPWKSQTIFSRLQYWSEKIHKDEQDRKEEQEDEEEEEELDPKKKRMERTPGNLNYQDFEELLIDKLKMSPKDAMTLWKDMARQNPEDKVTFVHAKSIAMRIENNYEQLKKRNIRSEVLEVLNKWISDDSILRDPQPQRKQLITDVDKDYNHMRLAKERDQIDIAMLMQRLRLCYDKMGSMDHWLIKNIFSIFQYDVNNSETISCVELCSRFSSHSAWARNHLMETPSINHIANSDQEILNNSNQLTEPIVAGELVIALTNFTPVNFGGTSDFIVKFNFPRYMRVEGTNINDLQKEALNEEGHHISIENGTSIDFRIKMMVTKETLRNFWCHDRNIQMSISKVASNEVQAPAGYAIVTDWNDTPYLQHAGIMYPLFCDEDKVEEFIKMRYKNENGSFSKNNFGELVLSKEEGTHKFWEGYEFNCAGLRYELSYYELQKATQSVGFDFHTPDDQQEVLEDVVERWRNYAKHCKEYVSKVGQKIVEKGITWDLAQRCVKAAMRNQNANLNATSDNHPPAADNQSIHSFDVLRKGFLNMKIAIHYKILSVIWDILKALQFFISGDEAIPVDLLTVFRGLFADYWGREQEGEEPEEEAEQDTYEHRSKTKDIIGDSETFLFKDQEKSVNLKEMADQIEFFGTHLFGGEEQSETTEWLTQTADHLIVPGDDDESLTRWFEFKMFQSEDGLTYKKIKKQKTEDDDEDEDEPVGDREEEHDDDLGQHVQVAGALTWIPRGRENVDPFYQSNYSIDGQVRNDPPTRPEDKNEKYFEGRETGRQGFLQVGLGQCILPEGCDIENNSESNVEYKLLYSLCKPVDTVPLEERVDVDRLQDELSNLLAIGGRGDDMDEVITGILRKIKAWQFAIGEPESKEFMKTLKKVRTFKSAPHLFGADFREQTGLSYDEVSVILATCIDRYYFPHLVIKKQKLEKVFSQDGMISQMKEDWEASVLIASEVLDAFTRELKNDPSQIFTEACWDRLSLQSVRGPLNSAVNKDENQWGYFEQFFEKNQGTLSFNKFFSFLETKTGPLTQWQKDLLKRKLDRDGYGIVDFSEFQDLYNGSSSSIDNEVQEEIVPLVINNLYKHDSRTITPYAMNRRYIKTPNANHFMVSDKWSQQILRAQIVEQRMVEMEDDTFGTEYTPIAECTIDLDEKEVYLKKNVHSTTDSGSTQKQFKQQLQVRMDCVKGSPYWYRTEGERDSALLCTLEWIPSVDLKAIDAQGTHIYQDFNQVQYRSKVGGVQELNHLQSLNLLDTVYKKSYARAGLLSITPIKIKCLPAQRFENPDQEDTENPCIGARLALSLSGQDPLNVKNLTQEEWSEDQEVGKLQGKKTEEKDDRYAEYRFDNTFSVYVPDYKLNQTLDITFSTLDLMQGKEACYAAHNHSEHGCFDGQTMEETALYGTIEVNALSVFQKDPATGLHEEKVEVNMLCQEGGERFDDLGGKVGLGSKVILKLRWRPHFEQK